MQCLERWKGRFAELVETERGGQILEPVLAEIAEWKRSGLEQGRGRRREQDLASVSRSRDPRRSVDVEADVVVVRHERLARVQAHANTDRRRRKARLCLSGTGDGVARGREHAEERISLRVDLDTAMGSKRPAQEGAVIGERLRVLLLPELVQQFGRTLHIGEEKRDRPGRELGGHGTMMRQDERQVTRSSPGQ